MPQGGQGLAFPIEKGAKCGILCDVFVDDFDDGDFGLVDVAGEVDFADRTSAKETHCSILLEKDGSEHWDASINWPRWFSVPNSDDREVDGTPSASIDPHNSATILRRCQVLPAVREVLIV
jgi:hypothetical protein